MHFAAGLRPPPEERRYLFQSDLHGLVERALRAGMTLPPKVRELDEQLTEAAIEAQFDNVPV